ncbi:kinase-like domain-containing protein, partial [Mycena rosella]
HQIVRTLAATLGLLPEDLSISGVVLSNDRPVKHGGFSDIFRADYLNKSGDSVAVALKVLRIFQDETDNARERTRSKFFKEVLVWWNLKHENIVPFLGVDSTTFPSPEIAMVTRWMHRGDVISYMEKNSPCSPYAMQLVNLNLAGLQYLHSENLVHGDLRGGNILVDDEGHACLTDFGLAAFIESDTSVKSSTRSGTTRWMAP